MDVTRNPAWPGVPHDYTFDDGLPLCQGNAGFVVSAVGIYGDVSGDGGMCGGKGADSAY